MNVLTLGTFDLFHYGHINLLQRCIDISRGKVENVYVGLNTDEFIEKYKGRRPILTYEERQTSIIETGLVFCGNILKNNQSDGTIKDVFEKSNPRFIVIGSDWHSKDYLKQLGLDWDYLREWHCDICYVPYTDSISTTEIKRRILEN